MKIYEKYNLEAVIKSIRKGEAGFTTLEDIILQAQLDVINEVGQHRDTYNDLNYKGGGLYEPGSTIEAVPCTKIDEVANTIIKQLDPAKLTHNREER